MQFLEFNITVSGLQIDRNGKRVCVKNRRVADCRQTICVYVHIQKRKMNSHREPKREESTNYKIRV